MEPAELSAEVQRIVDRARARVGPDSIGAQQYHVEGEPQKFETMTLDGLFEYFQEEIDDIINYAVMLSIRLDRLRRASVQLEKEIEEAGNAVRNHQSDEASGVQREDGVPLGPTAFAPVHDL